MILYSGHRPRASAKVSVYRCYFLNKIGSHAGWTTVYSNSDFNVRLRVLDLLRDHPRVQTVEVWQETRLAFRHCRETQINTCPTSSEAAPNYRH